MVSSFNREDVHLKRRVDRIENRLGLPPME